MQLVCSHCQRVVDFSDERPSFCGFCGKPLTEPRPESTIEVETRLAIASEKTGDNDPEVIGNYRLRRRLGAGGMGTVYEAEDLATGRCVALKLIAARFAESPEAVQRFRQEGRLASALAHSRCVFVLAADEAAGRPYIVMELMPGQTLRDLVERQGPLPPEEAVARILDVIDGLREAHRIGVIHRDVKPSNCFLEADGRVKIGDFGLSRSLVSESHLTRTGAFLGTPAFASPEQIRRDPLDPQTDVYSTAATLYYLLTGRAPHESADASATMARIVADPAPSVRTLRPDVSPALDRVVLRGLERQRERRWRNLDEFRSALLPFAPGKLSIGGMGIRFAAFLIDFLLIFAIVAVIVFLVILITGQDLVRMETGFGSNLTEVLNPLVWLAYFTVLEGTWGCSLGKWLLRLRVSTALGMAIPRLSRLLARNIVAYLLTHLGSLPILIGMWVMGIPGPETDGMAVRTGCTYAVLGLLFYPLTAVGVGILACTMRARNGYRGLHEFASGTRVVSLPEPERRRTLPDRLGQHSFHPDGLPERVGPFVVRGALRWGPTESVLLGKDPGLGRMVVLWLRPASAPALGPVRRDLVRPTRWRWLTAGEHDGRQWDAFLASPGCSLPDLVAGSGPLSWAETRQLLDQLTEELLAAGSDGTLPSSLDVSQVWLQASGQVQLLDMPVGESGASAPEGRLCSPPSPAHQDQQCALGLLRQTAILALEGRLRPDGSSAPPLRAPLPGSAARCLHRLLNQATQENIQTFQVEHASLRDRPTEVTRTRRTVHLALLTVFLAAGLFCCMFPGSAAPGMMTTMFNLLSIQAGEQALPDLEVGATSAFLCSGLDPNPFVRLYAVEQFRDDLQLRERLQRRLEEVRRERQAYLDSVGIISRLYIAQIEQQLEKDRKTGPAAKRRPPGPPGDFREQARTVERMSIRGEDVFTPFFISLALMLFTWPVLWVNWAFLARGGLSYRLAGLDLVRSDGRKASRLQCAWRAFLVWLPLTALLGLSAWLELRYWMTWMLEEAAQFRWMLWLSGAAWWAAVVLLAAYLVLALWSPARALHDRLAGTYLVPR
jgi:uncharacterized RDD family membrane protein YckC